MEICDLLRFVLSWSEFTHRPRDLSRPNLGVGVHETLEHRVVHEGVQALAARQVGEHVGHHVVATRSAARSAAEAVACRDLWDLLLLTERRRADAATLRRRGDTSPTR